MSVDIEKLLQDAENVLDVDCMAKVSELVLSPDTRLVDGSPTHERIKDLLPTLKVRLLNSTGSQKEIFGLSSLVAKLSGMESSSVVLGYGFLSEHSACNIYIDDSECIVLGVAIVEISPNIHRKRSAGQC